MVLVFLSYSHQDEDFSSHLRSDLTAHGIQVWRDRENIPYGQPWDDVIEYTLRSGDITHVLVILSKASVQSPNVRDEIGLSVDLHIETIPLLLEDCERPLRIVRLNYVDFRGDYDSAFSKLLDQLRFAAKSLPKVETVVKPTFTLIPTEEQCKISRSAAPFIRLVAGPGTGKSLVIADRCYWLLNSGAQADSIFVVSFTREASRDLRKRIVRYSRERGINSIEQVSVSTLHSLALRALRKAKLLQSYPVDPRVMDPWELKYIFDAEFAHEYRIRPAISRSEQIRSSFEAYWSTDQWTPPNYAVPDPPITDLERDQFIEFYSSASQIYSVVLPGEIVRKCLDYMDRNTIDVVRLLGIKSLIVDEFQDLNNVDQSFADKIATDTKNIFVAGDDDQSLYSFRFAYPQGIQTFCDANRYPYAEAHELTTCFRCTPRILEAVKTLIEQNPAPHRIKKSLRSAYFNMSGGEGILHQWRFRSGIAEARAIAASCRKLITGGINPQDILLLIGSRGDLLRDLRTAFEEENLPVEYPRRGEEHDTDADRLTHALVRIACDTTLQDYIAHRTVLGLLDGVGPGLCVSIRRKVTENNLNYLDIFYRSIPETVFNPSEIEAIERARAIFNQVIGWSEDDKISERVDTLLDIVAQVLSSRNVASETNEEANGLEFQRLKEWYEVFRHTFPKDMTLRELLDFLNADTSETQAELLTRVYDRLEIPVPDAGVLPARIRIMTFHGVKGLNAEVVFIPGLEEAFLPGPRRQPYPGLVQEAARLLYVAISRARAACVLSYATSRRIHGRMDWSRPPTRFVTNLPGRFEQRSDALSDSEATDIVRLVTFLKELDSRT